MKKVTFAVRWKMDCSRESVKVEKLVVVNRQVTVVPWRRITVVEMVRGSRCCMQLNALKLMMYYYMLSNWIFF